MHLLTYVSGACVVITIIKKYNLQKEEEEEKRR
jgi:hypothetical protein